MNEPAYNQK